MASHSVQSDEEFAFSLQQQELAILNDSRFARNLQKEDDDSIMIVDDDGDDGEAINNQQATAQDEEIARQLQQEFDEESRIEHTRRQYHRVDRPRVTPCRRVARPRSYGDDPNRPMFVPTRLSNLHQLVVNGRNVSSTINGVHFAFDDSDFNHLDTDDYEALWDLAEENGDVRRRGLDSHEINVLPTSKFTENVPSSTSNSDKAVSEDAECRICLSQFQRNDTLRTLPCLHKFHRDCIDNWIQRNAVCPVCRVKLRDQISNEN